MKTSRKRTVRDAIVAHAYMYLICEESESVGSKVNFAKRKLAALSSASAVLPKAKPRVVTPNMIILGRDEVKPGLLRRM